MSGNLLVKRRFPRRRFRRPIGILLDGHYHINRGEEVGEGGLSVISQFDLPEGKNVIVTFALEDELHIMRGEVRSKKAATNSEYVLGIAFLNIGFQYKKLIRRYIGAKTEQELDMERRERSNLATSR